MSAPHQEPYKTPGWPGYNLEELRYRRAYVQARLEIDKARIIAQLSALQPNSNKQQALTVRSGFSLANIVKYAEYGLVAYKAVSRITKLFRKR